MNVQRANEPAVGRVAVGMLVGDCRAVRPPGRVRGNLLTSCRHPNDSVDSDEEQPINYKTVI
jgi:hypothetical protein